MFKIEFALMWIWCEDYQMNRLVKLGLIGKLICMIKKWQAYFYLFKQHKLFCYKNFVTNEIRLAKNQYYLNKFDQYKNDCKKSWKLINSILQNKNKNHGIAKVNVDEVDLTQKYAIAETLYRLQSI